MGGAAGHTGTTVATAGSTAAGTNVHAAATNTDGTGNVIVDPWNDGNLARVAQQLPFALRALPDRIEPRSGAISAQIFMKAASYQPKEHPVVPSGQTAVGPKAAVLSRAAAAGPLMRYGTSQLDDGGNDDSQSSGASSEESNPWADMPPLDGDPSVGAANHPSASSRKEAQGNLASSPETRKGTEPSLQVSELSAPKKAQEAAAADFQQVLEGQVSEEEGFCKVASPSV